jgi:RNA polymerase sigma-70 factor, ECF subfamily
MAYESSDVEELLLRAAVGEQAALAALFDLHRERLLRMVRLRLDRRLMRRLDPNDVLQEAFIDMACELPRYTAKPDLPFFLWLRLVTAQRLMRLHREHLGAAMRDAGREVPLDPTPESSSILLAEGLVGHQTTPSQAAQRAERQAILQAALEAMEPIDREVIALRHFEGLTNNEVARILDLSKAAASNRYVRAMGRLQKELGQVLGDVERP